MFNTRVLLGTVVGSHVNAVVELPEAFLPRIVGVALVGRYELELARRGVHQWHVVLKHRLVQTFPVEIEVKLMQIFYRQYEKKHKLDVSRE